MHFIHGDALGMGILGFYYETGWGSFLAWVVSIAITCLSVIGLGTVLKWIWKALPFNKKKNKWI